MIIEQVSNIEDARQCDKLLSKLIQSESMINKNIKSNYIVKGYFEKIYDNKNGVIYVAKECNKIIGYVYCKCITSSKSPEIKHEALIDGIYVEEECRTNGIGTKLLEQAKKWCKANNINFLYLNVLENNKKAMKLYKMLGYEDFERKLKLEIK